MQKISVGAGRAPSPETSTAEAVTTLNEIIERLEKARGPDRELDALIVAELHDATMRPYPPSDDFGWQNKWQFWTHDGKHFLGSEAKFPVPAYTSSVDAALTLVLPDADWIIGNVNGHVGGTPYACVGSLKEHFGATPVLALCIAALRDRASRDTPSSPEETEASQAKPQQNTVED